VNNGRKHLTKAEIAARQAAEIRAAADNIKPPGYLPKPLKRKFKALAKQMLPLGIISNLDCDALARYLIAESQYLEITERIAIEPLMISVVIPGQEDYEGDPVEELVVNPTREKLLIQQDRLFKQCRQGASDFGLTVTSRCRLAVPKKEEAKVNKFERFARTG